jgi:tetratricopeptide (TPR) repeat protein
MDERLAVARQLSLRGADAMNDNRMGDAETYFSEALQSCPADERAQWGYAEALWNRGHCGASIHHMQEAIRLSGNNPEYRIRLGQMYLSQRDIERARHQARSILDHDQKNAKAWALLGDVERSAQQWTAAMHCYHRALLIRSDYPEVQIAMADIYRHVGRPERTLATLDRLADLHPDQHNDAESSLIRGLALAELGRKEDAIESLSRAARHLPAEQSDRLVDLAAAQYRLGELVDARMTLGKILQRHPDHAAAKSLQSTLDLSFAHLAYPVHDLPLRR